ncbi:MAG: hypothetical protein ACFFBD_24320, partial [Candidatus Hodarchaeota archaeon]
MSAQKDAIKETGQGDMLLPLDQDDTSSDEVENKNQSLKKKKKMKFKHFFSKSNLHPFDEIEWEK